MALVETYEPSPGECIIEDKDGFMNENEINDDHMADLMVIARRLLEPSDWKDCEYDKDLLIETMLYHIDFLHSRDEVVDKIYKLAGDY